MSTRKAPILSLVSALLGLLMATSAMASKTASNAEVDAVNNFHLKGILISDAKRSILVNDTLVGEGDRVAGAEIVSIGHRDVRIRVGSLEQSIRVGFSGEWPQPSLTDTTNQADPGNHYVAVKRGDTLSHIAERQLRGTVTRHQMMIALFEANPQAFAGNINVLREGAVLHIPDDTSLLRQTPETAVAEVVRQTTNWRAKQQQRKQLAEISKPIDFDPVVHTNAPATVSARVLHSDITTNKRRSTELKTTSRATINSADALQDNTELSIANVMHEISTWWHDSGQPLQIAGVINSVNTTYDSFIEQSNTLLPMKGHE